MDTTAKDRDLAALLEHSVWVRRLAASLLRDDAAADDLTQEAWLSALRHPPQPGLPVRPWLAQVVRNLVRMRFRGERRRREREEVSSSAQARDAVLDSPEQLVQRVETQRSLASLVVKLEEPYRATILLRYYEGLDSADIAARQGVPAGTVRWRLKTGLDKLRVELDRSHGGQRQAWLPIIAPLAIDRAGQGASPAIPTTAKLTGVLTMKVIIPLFLLISASATGVYVVKGRHSAPRQPPAVTQPSIAQPRPAAMPRLDKQQRAQLFQRITQAQQAASALANRRTEAAPAEPPELSAAYIRSQIQTLMPLLKECYENALRDKPQLAGKLVVNFSIVAEPDIGGLVTDSTVDTAQSTIADEGMRECVQETMYGAQFPAPQDGGEVKVTYPFIFKSEDD